MNFTYKIQIYDVGIPIVKLLSKKYTYYSLEDWTAEIAKENILVNNQAVKPEYLLKLNDEISFSVLDFKEPLVDEKISIVYEDEFLVAINKSGNLPVHPAGRYRENNLTTLLEKSNILSSKVFIVNRLDRETSGIVLFGKSSFAASKLGKLFELNKIQKTYISYVEGFFPERLTAIGYLEKDESSPIRKKKKFTYEKRDTSLWSVHTDFQLIQESNGVSKIFAYPHTGKIHQIRATLYSIGYPVVGDKIYGYDEKLFLEFIETGTTKCNAPINRQALHAYSVEFIHPFTDKDVVIRAEEPEDMRAVLE